jgi:Ca-activated chloride channel homolog
VAATRLSSIKNEKDSQALAVRYQLMTRWTNYLVIHVRAEGEKAANLPELQKVAQTVAAGWHGIGTVDKEMLMPPPSMQMPFRKLEKKSPGISASDRCEAPICSPERDMFDIIMNEDLSDYRQSEVDGIDLLGFIAAGGSWQFLLVKDLADLGVPQSVVDALQALVSEGKDERAVVITLLYLACDSDEARVLDRHTKREVLSAFKAAKVPVELVDAIREAIISSSGWGITL